MFSVPLAHGVLGIWDEAIPVILLVLIGIIAFLSGAARRRRDAESTPDADETKAERLD